MGTQENRSTVIANEFVEQVEAAGMTAIRYAGRSWWFGPSVEVDDANGLVEAIRATDMPIQWDSLGSGYVVYPMTSNKDWYDANPDGPNPDDIEEDEDAEDF